MSTKSYTADGVAMANLIANNIYNEISSICELVADYYDADATKVDITLDTVEKNDSPFISQITLCGDGDGMSESTLTSLMYLGSSNKPNRVSPKFNRSPLGSFGIAFASILKLGDSIDIFTRCSENTPNEAYYVTLSKNESEIPLLSPIKVINDDNHLLIPYKTGTTLLIKQCNIDTSVFNGDFSKSLSPPFTYLQNKLAFLPISKNFSVTLQSNPISKIDFPVTSCYPDIPLNNTSITKIGYLDTEYIYFPSYIKILDNILPFHIYFKPPSSGRPFSPHDRSIRLSMHDRIIDFNYLDVIKSNLSSPGVYSARIFGIIHADSLFKFMNASRNGLVDSKIHLLICKEVLSTLRIFTQKIKSSHKNQAPIPLLPPQNNSSPKPDDTSFKSSKRESPHTSNDTKNSHYFRYQQRIELVKNRLKSPNTKLKALGIQFCYNPNNEPETLFLISQLCQLNLLPFNLLECISSSYPDAIIAYENRANKFGFMEIEYSLGNFFSHTHSIYDVDMICCWQIGHNHLNNEINKYLSNNTEILDIKLKEPHHSSNNATLICSLDTGDNVQIDILVISKFLDNM